MLIELNELNFDVVSEYVKAGYPLPNFSKIFDLEARLTSSEVHYHLLEPWIQWPSVHTGRTFDEHQIFRLGDASLCRPQQIFEILESHGLSVGAVSPMNAVNALRKPAYFIPDPWTDTPSDGGIFSRMLTSALKQTVNDNSSGQITLTSMLYLSLCFLFLVRVRSYPKLFMKALRSRGKPWRKALFLDRFLHEVHLNLFFGAKASFTTLFLNAGAHIQHHYFLNSQSKLVKAKCNPSWYVAREEDPVGEMLVEYDEILGDILNTSNTEILIATGLTQKPVGENVFYYRLRDHDQFLKRLGLPVKAVAPRMTRDFLISCETHEASKLVEAELGKIVTRDGRRLFGEIDNRGSDLFVVLDYSSEITDKTEFWLGGTWHKLAKDVVFVAVKNGEHDGRGFAYFSKGLQSYLPENNAHVSKLHSTICRYFGIEVPAQ